jgi:hypothetical protein
MSPYSNGTVSTVSVAGKHTLHPQHTPVHQDGQVQMFGPRGRRMCAPNITSTSTERLAVGTAHPMYTAYMVHTDCVLRSGHALHPPAHLWGCQQQHMPAN